MIIVSLIAIVSKVQLKCNSRDAENHQKFYQENME